MNPAETRQITLTEFLLARIAEDEAGAQTGRNDHWRVEGGETWEHQGRPYELVGGGKHLATFDVDHGTLPSIHIARWSPARVLAECEAKRRIIKFHESWPVLVQTPPEFGLPGPSDPSDPQSMTFRMTQQITWATEQEYRTRFGDEPPTTPMLRALASIYADHPDFREEWRA